MLDVPQPLRKLYKCWYSPFTASSTPQSAKGMAMEERQQKKYRAGKGRTTGRAMPSFHGTRKHTQNTTPPPTTIPIHNTITKKNTPTTPSQTQNTTKNKNHAHHTHPPPPSPKIKTTHPPTTTASFIFLPLALPKRLCSVGPGVGHVCNISGSNCRHVVVKMLLSQILLHVVVEMCQNEVGLQG